MEERKFKRCDAIAYYRITEPEQFKDQQHVLQKVEIAFEYDSDLIFEHAVKDETAKIIRKRCVESYQSFEIVEIIDKKDERVLFRAPAY